MNATLALTDVRRFMPNRVRTAWTGANTSRKKGARTTSILIKGMRMPENCIKCPMQFGGMCYVMPAEVDESRVAPTVEEALKQGKPDWCPLVEIPAHGRLIDASYKVDMPFYDDEYEENSVRTVTVEELLLMADNEVPTVIEAEGSENHDD